MSESPTVDTPVRKRRFWPWFLLLLLPVLGWYFRSEFQLTWHLDLLAKDIFARVNPNERLSEGEAMNYVRGNADIVDVLKPFRANQVALRLRYDPSARRRAIAAAALAHRDPEPDANLIGVGPQLVDSAMNDSSPLVRDIARSSLGVARLPAGELAKAIETVAKLPLDKQPDLINALTWQVGTHDMLTPLMLRIAREGHPDHRIWAVGELRGNIDSAEAANITADAYKHIGTRKNNLGITSTQMGLMVDYAPHEAARKLQSDSPEARQLVIVLGNRIQHSDSKTYAAALDPALKLLGTDDRNDWKPALNVVVCAPGGFKRLIEYIKPMKEPHRSALIDYVLKFSPERRTRSPNADDLEALASIIGESDQRLEDAIANLFVAACLYSPAQVDIAGLPWTDNNRALFRRRINERPIPGGGWYLSMAAMVRSNPTEEDLEAFERFLQTGIAKSDSNSARGGNFADGFVQWYGRHAGKERATPFVIAALRTGSDHSMMGPLLYMVRSDDALLEQIADVVIGKAAVPDVSYWGAANNLLLKKPRTLKPEIWKNLWQNWLRVLPLEPREYKYADMFGNQVVEHTPSIFQARKMVPPEIAAAGVREFVRAQFKLRPETRGRASELSESQLRSQLTMMMNWEGVSDAALAMPEFPAAFAESVREVVQDPDPRMRFLTIVAVNRHKHDPELMSEILDTLLADENKYVVRDALQYIGQESRIPITPAISAKVRRLAQRNAPLLTRSTAMTKLVHLPDRTDADFALALAAQNDPDERVRFASRHVVKTWTKPSK